MLHALIATEKYPKMLMAIPLIQGPIKIIFPIIHLRLSGENTPNDLSPKKSFTCKGCYLEYESGILELTFRAGITFFRKIDCIFLLKH
jgi:hypothetical protein